MRIALLLIVCCVSFGKINAQVLPTDTVPAIINYSTTNGLTKFTSELRPLRQIAGAPAPFYTYFWEFGDGSFSFEKEPVHIFKGIDSVKVRLFATNNYDDGKRPPTKPKPIKPAAGKPIMAANPSSPTLFKMGGNIELKSNCMPKPGDDMMLIMGYRNQSGSGQANLDGTIAILYNDQEFTHPNFTLSAARTYHGEKKGDLKPMLNVAQATLKSAQPVYYAALNEAINPTTAEEKLLLKDKLKEFKSEQSWKFENLKEGEERFVFLHFKTTPEMLKDTNAIVKISAAFIPNHPLAETEFFNMELQIVASHDPNKMALRKSRMSYRFTSKNRVLSYKVRFQNTGKGPAKKIAIAINVPEVFDVNTLKIVDTKPKVVDCEGAYSNQSCISTIKETDSVRFIFNNIYLPGTQQKDVNDPDSTMGYVAYTIAFKEKPKKLPIKSGAAIVFDKNEPIYTNRAVGRFKMGLSPSLILGYGFPFETDNRDYLNNKNIVIGASLAPYAPHRLYWQVEVYLNSFKENTALINSTVNNKDTVINRLPYRIDKKDHFKTTKVITINAVPLQLRYNINKYLGTGLGTLVSLNLSEKEIDELKYNLTAAQNGASSQLNVAANTLKKHFSTARVSFFADVQIGLVRVGPSLGFRYMYDPKSNNNRMGTYITWKF